MKTQNVLNAFGFEQDLDNTNLYYRKAEDGNHDVIRYFPEEDLYNVCMLDYSCDFIDETQILKLLVSE